MEVTGSTLLEDERYGWVGRVDMSDHVSMHAISE